MRVRIYFFLYWLDSRINCAIKPLCWLTKMLYQWWYEPIEKWDRQHD